MTDQQTDVRSNMAVFRAQRAKVDAFTVLQALPRSFDDTLERLTKAAVDLRKGKMEKDEVVRTLAEIIRGDIPQLRMKLMDDIQDALERMDEVNNSLANELVKMQLKYGQSEREEDS